MSTPSLRTIRSITTIPPRQRRCWRNPRTLKMRTNKPAGFRRLLLREHAPALETREAMPRPTTFDAATRSIEAVIASTTPVRRTDTRGSFWEVLDPAGLDLDVTRGASVLDSHVRG